MTTDGTVFLALPLQFAEKTSKHILFHIFSKIVDFKRSDGGQGAIPAPSFAYGQEMQDAINFEGGVAAADVTAGAPSRAIPVAKAVRVDLAPMKEVGGLQSLESLDPNMHMGGRQLLGDNSYKK